MQRPGTAQRSQRPGTASIRPGSASLGLGGGIRLGTASTQQSFLYAGVQRTSHAARRLGNEALTSIGRRVSLREALRALMFSAS